MNGKTGRPGRRLSLREMSLQIADILLIAEGDVSWVEEPRVRRGWHALVVATFVFSVLGMIAQPALADFLRSSSTATLSWRLLMVGGWIVIITLLMALAVSHFRYMVLTAKDLRFKGPAFFYSAGVIGFAWLHKALHCAYPWLYDYKDPPVQILPELTNTGIVVGLTFSADFLVYSACTILTLNNRRVTSASTLVSGLEAVEAILGLIAFGLVLATLVQRTDTKGRSRK